MRRRPHLWWLLAPYALFLVAIPFVNRVRPTLGGVPFLFCWLCAATLATPLLVHLAHRGDRRYLARARAARAGAPDGPGGGAGPGAGTGPAGADGGSVAGSGR